MTSSSAAYAFVLLAVFCFIAGFCGEELRLRDYRDRKVWLTVLGLAVFWFLIDEIAVKLGLWTFPMGKSLPIRVFSLPPEEYLLFFVHTILCLALLRHYGARLR